MSTRSDEVFLAHMLEEIAFVSRHCYDLSYEAFLEDEVLQRAVVRSLEVLGEAAKNLTPRFRARHPHIEWQRIAGLRDVLIHRYFGVDWPIVWDVVRHKLPVLEAELQRLTGRNPAP